MIDDRHIRVGGDSRYIWTADGASFDVLTLTPSVDASKQGHWHGFITKGKIT